ncbi:MAG: hypothetical protein JWN03_1353 [Nocardia sp.]|uniref:DUF397 domain-containing protein n=1 Tax=Nocardia sp. TaxID=1821 RepID=UPI00260597C5|nr:DUF397 domain-containing protein [Nocardia sp.]MCU1641078.1 hypothetical protein [Nocardia sp.]
MTGELDGAQWFKSSYSGDKADCIEVAFVDDSVGVRDSKNQAGPPLVFSWAEWQVFTGGVLAGRF